MSTLNLVKIPAEINTLEKLHAWSAFALQKCNPTKTIVEQPNTDPINLCSVSIFRADDQSLRLLTRINLPLDSDYAESASPIWENTNEISNTDIPPSYLEP